jgi:hypothetical protein
VLGFELRAMPLLDRCSTPWAMPQHFCFSYFLNGISLLCPGWPGPQSCYLSVLCKWDDRCTPLCPAFYWLIWGLTNFLPRLALNHDPPNLYLLSSWDYRCEPLLPASLTSYATALLKRWLPLPLCITKQYTGNACRCVLPSKAFISFHFLTSK